MKLKDNQSALILESDEEGVTGVLYQAIATKLMQDEEFQADLMEMLEE